MGDLSYDWNNISGNISVFRLVGRDGLRLCNEGRGGAGQGSALGPVVALGRVPGSCRRLYLSLGDDPRRPLRDRLCGELLVERTAAHVQDLGLLGRAAGVAAPLAAHPRAGLAVPLRQGAHDGGGAHGLLRPRVAARHPRAGQEPLRGFGDGRAGRRRPQPSAAGPVDGRAPADHLHRLRALGRAVCLCDGRSAQG